MPCPLKQAIRRSRAEISGYEVLWLRALQIGWCLCISLLAFKLAPRDTWISTRQVKMYRIFDSKRVSRGRIWSGTTLQAYTFDSMWSRPGWGLELRLSWRQGARSLGLFKPLPCNHPSSLCLQPLESTRSLFEFYLSSLRLWEPSSSRSLFLLL